MEELEVEAAGFGTVVDVALGRWCDWVRKWVLLSSLVQILINSSKSFGREI